MLALFVSALPVEAVPLITKQPFHAHIGENGEVALLVDAQGGGLHYQWYRGTTGDTSAPLAGATGRPLILQALAATESFWVRVSDADGSADSEIITVRGAPRRGRELRGVGENYSGELADGSVRQRAIPVQIASDVVSVASGGGHTLLLKTDASLWAVGKNEYGQLGDGSTKDKSTPVKIAEGVVSMDANRGHSLFIKTDGSLWAMGQNEYGKLGDGTTTQRSTPVQVATAVAQVAASAVHSLFLKTDGSVWFMGSNASAQMGTGYPDNLNHSTPLQIATDVSKIAVGDSHNLLLKTDQTLWGMGNNVFGQLGLGWFNQRTPLTQIDSQVTDIAAGSYHSLYLPADGQLRATGGNDYGQLGNNSASIRFATPVITATNVQRIAAGFAHTAFIKTNGSLWFSGLNNVGQLGTGDLQNRLLVTQVAPNGVAKVFTGSGSRSSFILKTDGTLWAVGNNFAAQLADGSVFFRALPATIATDVTDFSAGYSRTTFIKSDGTLWVAPGPDYPLGNGSAVQIGAGFASLSVAGHTLLLKDDGTLWGMGSNGSGQLGDSTTTDRSTPIQITTQVARIAVGGSHSLFVKRNGTLWGMGYNHSSQLGDGTTTNRTTPILIANEVVQASSGTFHSLFLKTDGSLWGMGDNNRTKLGINPDPVSYRFATPVQIANDVSRIAAGGNHSLFVKKDGSLWAMGDSDYGQLGYPFPSNPSPTQVATQVRQVSAGANHSLFVKTDGSLWSMGQNTKGQLGDGSTLSRSTPTQIASGIVAISAFSDNSLFLLGPSEFATWVAASGLVGVDAAPDADPDSDGVPNLLEYGFSLSSTSATPPALLPSVHLVMNDEAPGLALTHRRRKDSGLIYRYLAASDLTLPLIDWAEISPVPELLDPDVDGDGLTELVSVIVPLDGAPKRFLRLSVEE
ncbi:MAG: hypothetical protein H7067_03640 [Burkholderiales bacterium]|nr:hypothetical protein [Opitutaceae bacterium]